MSYWQFINRLREGQASGKVAEAVAEILAEHDAEEPLWQERNAICSKAKITNADRKRLQEIEAAITNQRTDIRPEILKAGNIIQRAADLLGGEVSKYDEMKARAERAEVERDAERASRLVLGDALDRLREAFRGVQKERDERITLEQAAELLHDADNCFRVCLHVIRLALSGDERQFCRVYQCARDVASIGILNLKKLGRWYETEAGDADPD